MCPRGVSAPARRFFLVCCRSFSFAVSACRAGCHPAHISRTYTTGQQAGAGAEVGCAGPPRVCLRWRERGHEAPIGLLLIKVVATSEERGSSCPPVGEPSILWVGLCLVYANPPPPTQTTGVRHLPPLPRPRSRCSLNPFLSIPTAQTWHYTITHGESNLCVGTHASYACATRSRQCTPRARRHG